MSEFFDSKSGQEELQEINKFTTEVYRWYTDEF